MMFPTMNFEMEELLPINIPSVVLRYNAKKKLGKDKISLKEWTDMEDWLVDRLYGNH